MLLTSLRTRYESGTCMYVEAPPAQTTRGEPYRVIRLVWHSWARRLPRPVRVRFRAPPFIGRLVIGQPLSIDRQAPTTRAPTSGCQPAEPRPVRLSPWTRRTDAPTHRRTPECAHISLPLTRSLGLCAHFAGCAVNLPPRIKNVRTFVKTDGRLAERKSAHKWTMPLGERGGERQMCAQIKRTG